MDQIACGACGKAYQINPSYYGKSFQCQCGQLVNVPHPGGMPPPPPPHGYAPPQPGYAPPYPGYGAPAQGTPGIVIAGFVLSFFGWLAIIGLILCAVGIGEAKRRNAGVGLATAGIVISIVVLVSTVIWVAAVYG
jgi:hypothetical protein